MGQATTNYKQKLIIAGVSVLCLCTVGIAAYQSGYKKGFVRGTTVAMGLSQLQFLSRQLEDLPTHVPAAIRAPMCAGIKKGLQAFETCTSMEKAADLLKSGNPESQLEGSACVRALDALRKCEGA